MLYVFTIFIPRDNDANITNTPKGKRRFPVMVGALSLTSSTTNQYIGTVVATVCVCARRFTCGEEKTEKKKTRSGFPPPLELYVIINKIIILVRT